MSTFWKQTLEAALWTFLEAFIATFAVSAPTIAVGDYSAARVATVAAGLAGLAALVSFVKSVIVRNIGEVDSTLITGGTEDVV